MRYILPLFFILISASPVLQAQGSETEHSTTQLADQLNDPSSITIDHIRKTTSSGRYSGTISVSGGLPALDGSHFSATLTKKGNPSIRGSVKTSVDYGKGLPFTVPEAGTYQLQISDKHGQSTTQTVTFRSDPTILIGGSADVQPGESFCVPVTVQNFDSVTSMQFSVEWNPLYFEFEDIQNFNLEGLNMSNFNTADVDEGHFSLVWLAPMLQEGESLSDGGVLFEVCFEAIGSPGDMSDFTVSGDPLFIEITTVNESGGAPVNTNPGKLNIISSEDLSAEYTSCSSPTGVDNGSFTLTIFGGMPPYDVQWERSNDPGVNGSGTVNDYGESITFSGLPPSAGTPFYDVTITDDEGNVVNLQVEIANSPPIFIDLGIQREPCPGLTNGMIGVDTFQSSPPNTLEWSTGQFNVTQISGLSEGVYSITLTDQFGCTTSDSVTLSIDSIEIDGTVTNATCEGVEDGSITVTASGGNPDSSGNYTFIWDNMTSETGSSSTLSNVGPGNYTVTVTDENNCIYTETFTVEAEQYIAIDDLLINPVSCVGDTNGNISFTVSMIGGPEPSNYVFRWSPFITSFNNGDSVWTPPDLAPGEYDITIYDDATLMGCQLDTSFTISEPDSFLVSVNSKGDESCNQGGDGFISVIASGAVDYQWSNGVNGSLNDSLSAGEYTVTATNASGCTDSLTVTINQPTPPQITSFDSTRISCNATSDGSLTVNYQIGNAPIQDISWSPSGNGQSIDNLSAGQYSVTITAEDGCIAMDTVYLSEPDPLVFDSLSLTDPSCPGEATGQIIAHVSGGTTPYTYNWSVSGSSDNPVLPTLEAGTYGLTVIDANDCPVVDTMVALSDPPIITASFSNLSATSCFNTCDGQATVQGSGGSAMTGNYTYMWSTGESGSTANMLCPGENYVTVSDGICAIVDTVLINSPDSVQIELLENESVSCYGLSDGRLEILATGGTGPYDYSWSNMASGSANENITAGSYSVIVTDSNGCQTTSSFVVEQPDSLVVQIDSANTFQISCGGNNDGLISLLYTGGNVGGEYTFNWSPDVSEDATAEDLGPGLYEVTVSDENGCSDTTSIRLTAPPPIEFALPTPEEPNCFGEETSLTVSQASGGTGGPYTYTINNTGSTPVGDSIDVLAGTYLVSVFDGGGCAVDTQIMIDQPSPVQVNLGSDVDIALGDSILLQGEANSDVPLESYQWTPLVNLNCDTCLATYARPFSNQAYTLTATDVDGCQGSDEIVVRVNTTRQVYIPNVFTPNNDGINDHFEIFTGGGVAAINNIKVFNRWGDLVYEARNLPPDPSGLETWDGTFNGQRMAPGVFVYMVEVSFLDGRSLTFRGDISLVR